MLWNSLLLAVRAIRRNVLRSFLTILGVVIGVASVIVMVTLGDGATQSVKDQMQSLGANLLTVRPGMRMGPGRDEALAPNFKQADVDALAEQVGSVKAVVPNASSMATVVYQAKNWQTTVQGSTAAYFQTNNWRLASGRFFSETESKSHAPLAVIGVDIVEALFPSVDPVGKEIMIDNRRYDVVGIMERKGKFLGHSRDNLILIPLGSFESHPADFNYMALDLIPTATEKIDDAIEQVREVLRRHRRLRFWQTDNFGIWTQDTLTDLYRRLTGGIYLVMIAISCIGLVVGGVGVMNIMLVSVTERTREIGVRKALGATKRDVRWQFLTEAMTLTGLGGTIGVLVGALVAWAVNLLSPFPAALQPAWVLIAFLSSVGVGLTFGLWPAVKAARLDPIEALRYE